jgi:agmatinase
MLKKTDLSKYDPNGAGLENAGIFGLPLSAEESSLILIPVPWEATTSYGKGTSRGPRAILEASPQLDLFDAELGQLGLARPWEYGLFMESEDPAVLAANSEACKLSAPIIASGGEFCAGLDRVNELSSQLNAWVGRRVRHWRSQGKLVGLVGGEHSTPFGAVEAFLEEYPGLGILQIDAHADLRPAYEGFTHSHASIMYNLLETRINRLVQVGVRDYCDSEYRLATSHTKLRTFFDFALKERLCQGESWHSICQEIVSHLPENVYVSFDIDGLEPALCPHTGTPVAGGLRFHEAVYLLKTLHRAGKRLVGFDLNEVAPGPDGDQWDGNVGARVLYKLCGLTLLSAGARD